MTGTLGLFSLLDVIQLLVSSSRTGCLNIKHPNNEANFYFLNGKLVHATFGNLQGEEAVVELFKDEQGAFEFIVESKTPETTITNSTENLLLMSIRAADESNKNASITQISETSVPIFATDAPDAGDLTLYAKEISILRLVDSTSNVSQISDMAHLNIKEVKQIIARLMRIGALSLRTRKPRVARLVTQLSTLPMPPDTVGIERKIINNWQKSLNALPTHVACKKPDGKVIVFQIKALDRLGPYILMTQEIFFHKNLAANTTLLVRPIDS